MSARKANRETTTTKKVTKTKPVTNPTKANFSNGSALKSFLKAFRLNESSISMILGAIVIVAVGLLVVNYYRNLKPVGTVTPGTQTEQKIDLPTTHKVASGDTLWSISEKYYGTGYNWIDIQKANNLSNANAISEGQEITIPAVEVAGGEKLAEATPTASPVVTASAKPTETPVATVTPMPTVKATATPQATAKPEVVVTPSSDKITGDSYTVVHGDNLWKIAERAYGDGNKWTEIAKANKLVNPNIIHAGNVFVLPQLK